MRSIALLLLSVVAAARGACEHNVALDEPLYLEYDASALALATPTQICHTAAATSESIHFMVMPCTGRTTLYLNTNTDATNAAGGAAANKPFPDDSRPTVYELSTGSATSEGTVYHWSFVPTNEEHVVGNTTLLASLWTVVTRNANWYVDNYPQPGVLTPLTKDDSTRVDFTFTRAAGDDKSGQYNYSVWARVAELPKPLKQYPITGCGLEELFEERSDVEIEEDGDSLKFAVSTPAVLKNSDQPPTIVEVRVARAVGGNTFYSLYTSHALSAATAAPHANLALIACAALLSLLAAALFQ